MTTKTNTSINGKDYYRIRRKIDGVQKSFYGSSKGDAERKYREYVTEKAKRDKERIQFVTDATFHDMASEYIRTVLLVSSKYANGTKEKYEQAYRCHIQESQLDRMKVSDISPTDIQRFYNNLSVSKQVLQNVSKFMRGFCRWMQMMGYTYDLISAVELPDKPDNKKTEEIIVWSDEDIRTITDACTSPSEPFRASFIPLTLLYTGMRLGECLALKYSDVHDGVIEIRRQYTHGEIKEPKYNSSRQIPLHPDLEMAFKKHKEWHRKEMKKNSYVTDYIFTTETGNLYNAPNLRRSLERFYRRIGIEYKEPHTYRRTFCTQLCKSGVPIQVACNLMGHKNISVTARFYASIDEQEKKSAIERLNW